MSIYMMMVVMIMMVSINSIALFTIGNRGSIGGSFPMLGILLDVGVEKEVKEEHEIAQVHDERPEDVVVADVTVELRCVQLGLVGHPVDVAAEEHLNDLQERDELRDEDGHVKAHGFESIVRVHDRVHHIVHAHEPATRCGKLTVAVPTVDEHSCVVIVVQKDQFLSK